MRSVPTSLHSVLVKPAGPDCNMKCDYCFYRQKEGMFPDPVHRMTGKVLEAMVRQMMSQSIAHMSFGWQGGEPTLMGLPFFQKIVDLQIRYGGGKNVGNGLQTNGLLIDSRWAAFLGQYKFLVGLSLDGPDHVHDHYRRALGGQGSWSTVADSVKLLLDADVEVNAVSVVTDYSSQFAEEIYQFHKDLGLTHMQFIPYVASAPSDPDRPATFSVSAEKFGNFLITLFDLWLRDVRDGIAATSIRYFDSVFHRYVGLSAPECTLLEECGNYLVVEHNGDVFPCDFYVQPEWKLGNILEGRLVDMLNSSRQREFGAMKAIRPDVCSTCPWLRFCYGGCTKDRMWDSQNRGKMHFCQSYKMFFEHANTTFKEMSSLWLSRQ
ncbi:MAG: anaerobic sulfatase maturase [Deltaproteobacteria bacterium]